MIFGKLNLVNFSEISSLKSRSLKSALFSLIIIFGLKVKLKGLNFINETVSLAIARDRLIERPKSAKFAKFEFLDKPSFFW